jgi:molecular chaperone HscB
LRQPITRGAYLAELQGHPVNAEDNTAMPATFLMQQMEWREALDEAQGDVNGLTQLADDTNAAKKTYLQLAELAFDTDKDIPRAVGAIRALMFIERFLKDVNQQLDALTP